MADNTNVFPFQFIDFPCKGGENKPFIEQVKNVLQTDIQKENSFGCKIQNCHTHAGSKIHFKHFIEAELLFHNSHYNKSFAWLSYDWLKKYLQENHLSGISNILLIGYEKYSELYLQDFRDIIKTNGKECFYCVYETVAETCKDGSRKHSVVIRNLNVQNNFFNINTQKTDQETSNDCFAINDTLCLFVVPINTSLSTMDKMISKFAQIVEKKGNCNSFSMCKRAHLCLITLHPIGNHLKGERNNEYWDFDKKDHEIEKDESPLIPKNGKFEFLNNNIKVHNIVAVGTNWFSAKDCDICYPSELTDEEPVFGVNRGSVVPMLRIGTIKAMKPISEEEKNKALANLKRVSELSEFLSYQHISRGENHYQYYLDAERLLLEKQAEIEQYLKSISDSEKKSSGDAQIFDYIIASRHESNARWVHMIHKNVFDESARIIYFDVEKEYRSNLKAKYSDIICGLENIEKSRQNYEIRFHFVDDTIQSGSTFLRAKNLISSLVPQSEHVKVFYSAYILINRISKATQDFYMGNHNRFYCYTDVNISPMRSFEDACTLCKLIADYYSIRSQCATNRLANICSNDIKRHMLTTYPKMSNNSETTVDTTDKSKVEKQLVFFITHLLNERLANRLYLKNIDKKEGPIDIERSDEDIKCILNDYYHNINFNEYTSFGEIDETVWKLAFIKAISRPFFINHIRQRQASFAFCLTQLDNLLKKDENEIGANESALIQTLVKALTDMNANYLLREKILDKLFCIAELSSSIGKQCEGDPFYTKRLFTSESLIHYLKKDLILSRDTTKSLLLERILLTGFEKKGDGDETSCIEKFMTNDSLSPRAFLYLENNVILKNGLSDSDSGNNLEKLSQMNGEEQIPYYIDNLNELWKLNTKAELSLLQTIEQYKSLKDKLSDVINNKKIQKDFSSDIDSLFDAIDSNEMQSIAFVYDNTEANPLFQFFTLAGKPANGTEILKNCKFKEIKTSQAFFYDNNLDEIRNNIHNQADKDIFFIENTLFQKSNTEHEKTYDIIVRFCEDIDLQEQNGNAKAYTDTGSGEKPINAVYLQIWGFNKSNLKHWFALKLLLTLREDFVKLIHSINLQELIKERKVDAQKDALAIKKATTHGKIDRYYELDFLLAKISKADENQTENAEKYYKYYVENHIHRHEAFPVLYDKYLQLLSDDFLPSIYKKIIKYEGCFNKVTLELEEYLDQIDHVFGGKFERINEKPTGVECELPITIIERHITIKDKQINKNVCLNVSLNIPIDKLSEYYVLRWNGEISAEMGPTISFILFAVNAVEHGNVETINVEINEDGVTFSNVINSLSVNANSQESIESEVFNKKNDIEKSYSIPPWVMEDTDQHLTLWTLFHAKGIYDTDNFNESFSPTVEIKSNAETDILEFTIKIKSIRKKEANR